MPFGVGSPAIGRDRAGRCPPRRRGRRPADSPRGSGPTGPLLPPLALSLAREIAAHYLAPPAVVIRAMLPPGLLERLELVARQVTRRPARLRIASRNREPGSCPRRPARGAGRAAAGGPRPPAPDGRAALLRRLRALADGRPRGADVDAAVARPSGPGYERRRGHGRPDWRGRRCGRRGPSRRTAARSGRASGRCARRARRAGAGRIRGLPARRARASATAIGGRRRRSSRRGLVRAHDARGAAAIRSRRVHGAAGAARDRLGVGPDGGPGRGRAPGPRRR